MRRASIHVVVFFALCVAACGGSQPATTQAPSGGSVPGVGAVAATLSVGDAGPTTTTTQTLGAGPSPIGTKLTGQNSADAGTDAGGKHVGEPGRTVLDLKTIVSSHRDEARACYDAALANHPSIEGTIDIRWTIDPSGKVTDADLDTSRSELVEPSVANCLIGIIKGIHFNASVKGFETKAHYPFNFHPRAHHAVSN